MVVFSTNCQAQENQSRERLCLQPASRSRAAAGASGQRDHYGVRAGPKSRMTKTEGLCPMTLTICSLLLSLRELRSCTCSSVSATTRMTNYGHGLSRVSRSGTSSSRLAAVLPEASNPAHGPIPGEAREIWACNRP